MASLNYVAPPTLAGFMESSAFARFAVGPIGSGKSMACIIELFRRMVQQAPDASGVRLTRFVIVRNTLQQLQQTCLADIQQYLGPICHFKISDKTLYFNQLLPDGTRVKSEWLLIPLEDVEDQRRLLSLQLTGAWLSEFREISFKLVDQLMGRLGRYPSKAVVDPTWFGLIAESNPYADGSEWHDALEVSRPDGWVLFRQPSGLSREAENINNLPGGYEYYRRLLNDHNTDWARSHIYAENSDDLSGQTVFRTSFAYKHHVAQEGLTPNPQRVLMVGLDFGRTPCAVLTQIDTKGRLLVFEEVISDGMGLNQFLTEKLRPVLYDARWAGCRIVVVADPAGRHKSELYEENAFDVLAKHGFSARPASTNDIAPRLRAVEQWLLENRGETRAFLIDPHRAPILTKALQFDYKYRRRKTGEIEDVPEKKHPTSDVCFVAGTPVATPYGDTLIENLRIGDLVHTHLGPRHVVATGSRMVDETTILVFSSKTSVRCTPNHPFASCNGWVEAANLQEGDILEGIRCHEGVLGQTSSNFLENGTTATARTTTTGANPLARQFPCTSLFGSTITALARMATIFTTSMGIRPTTVSATLPRFLSPITVAGTRWNDAPMVRSKTSNLKLVLPPRSGIEAPPVEHGTGNTAKRCGKVPPKKPLFARIAATLTRSSRWQENVDSAPLPANLPPAEHRVSTTKPEHAPNATTVSLPTGTPKHGAAPMYVAAKQEAGSAVVYNLTIDDAHTYYAGGVLVSNCDALQYASLGAQMDLPGRILRQEARRKANQDRPRLPVGAWT